VWDRELQGIGRKNEKSLHTHLSKQSPNSTQFPSLQLVTKHVQRHSFPRMHASPSNLHRIHARTLYPKIVHAPKEHKLVPAANYEFRDRSTYRDTGFPSLAVPMEIGLFRYYTWNQINFTHQRKIASPTIPHTPIHLARSYQQTDGSLLKITDNFLTSQTINQSLFLPHNSETKLKQLTPSHAINISQLK